MTEEPSSPASAGARWAKAVQAVRYARGLVDEDGTGRRARTAICPRCHCLCVTGLDADLMAWTVWVDPDAIDARGEYDAVMAGRETFSLDHRYRSGRRGYELNYRDRWNMLSGPPNPTTRIVLAAHACPARPIKDRGM